MKNTFLSISLLASLALVGCSPGQPSGPDRGSGFRVSGYASALTNREFNNLTPVQQYQVISKLTATVFKGIPVDEFFEVSAGMENPQIKMTNALSRVRAALATDLTVEQRTAVDAAIDGIDSEGNPNQDLALYEFDEDRPRSLPLARIHEYPLSRDGFVNWMAYFLANTIMFSPAIEMDSTDIINAQNIFRRLVTGINEGRSLRQIIRSHLPTVDRWRVSRSAENHGLEAYELYLGVFNAEEDHRRIGIACQDFYLTDADDGYRLVQGDTPNSTPQYILEDLYEVTTCDDFHDVIAGHPVVVARMTEAILNYFMDGRTLSDRRAMVESITNSGAKTFEDIFTAILFSKQYLLNTQRPKSFEESLMPLLDTLHWDVRLGTGEVDDRIFDDMTSNNNARTYLGGMGWDSMSLKIGRMPYVAMDAQSFGNYHKAVRESVLRLTNAYRGREVTISVQNPVTGDIEDQQSIIASLTRGDDGAGGVVLLEHLRDISPDDYLHFLFLTAAQRRATNVELTDLMALYGEGDLNWIRDIDNDGDPDISSSNNSDINVAQETFDFLSRLPEFYYFETIN